MDEKKEKLRKRDLALQAFFRNIQASVKELEQKYPELKLVDNEPINKPLVKGNISYPHEIVEAQNGASSKAKTHG